MEESSSSPGPLPLRRVGSRRACAYTVGVFPIAAGLLLWWWIVVAVMAPLGAVVSGRASPTAVAARQGGLARGDVLAIHPAGAPVHDAP